MTAPLRLPRPDRARSPLTGWTRDHWLACADHLLAGAARHTSPAGARIRFPGPTPQDATDELEGFARTFLLGALRLADHSGAADPTDAASRWASGLAAGTTPGHREAWPPIGHHDQVLVEATAVAVGLHWSRPWLWERLPERTREQVVHWLSGARGVWCADNNHVLFGATVQAFLGSVGADHDPAAIDAAINRVDDWYAGDGWYSDGPGRRFDHYNAWTFHLYPFFLEQLLEGVPAGSPGRSAAFDVHRSRLRMFLDDYQHLFDATGRPVLQGRSLVYRWGVAAPFWMGAIQGVSPLTAGRTRRLASGLLAGFADAGTLDPGVLDLGWKRPAPDLLQSYNAAGSPLWASKGFLGLLLPPDHPVWQEVEQPLAIEERDVVRPLAGPRWVVAGRRDDVTVRLLNHGTDGHPQHADRLYRRLAYSTATVPTTYAGLEDNTVSVGPRGAAGRHRGLLGGTVHRTGAASRWRVDAHGRDVVIDCATLVLGVTELRLARVRGALEQPVRCTGWAVSSDAPVLTSTGAGWACATGADGLTSAVAVVGERRTGSTPSLTVGVASGPHEHALGDHVGLPWLETDAAAEGAVHLAWLVHLGRGWDPAVARSVAVEWLPDGALVDADGHRHHCAWVRELPWPADAANQGIFRVGAAPLG